LAPWADVLYATDFPWWEKHRGVTEFHGLKLSQDPKVKGRPQWGVHQVEAVRSEDRLLVEFFGKIGWGGNSGFGAINLAVQFGVSRIVLVGFDMRLYSPADAQRLFGSQDRAVHWHGAHQGLHNPTTGNVARWRRVTDGAAPALRAMGVEVLNATPHSALAAYRKVDFAEWFNAEFAESEARYGTG
jgi:hypothetical protein